MAETRLKVAFVVLRKEGMLGQQCVEEDLYHALRALDDARLDLRLLEIKSWRAADSGYRIPLRLAGQPLAGSLMGRWLYSDVQVIHRLDLKLPAAPAEKEVLTVHDVAPLRYPDEGTFPASGLRSMRRAAALVSVSASSGDEIAEVARRDDVISICNGVPSDLGRHPILSSYQLGKLGIQGRFVLCTGGATARKNLEGLATAWRAVSSRVPDVVLVLAGTEPARKRMLFADVPAVLHVGLMERPAQIGLMRAAAAVVVPSKHEGFGLPALEGLALGLAVVASDISALREVCGTAALFVKSDPRAIGDGLERVLTNSSVSAQLRRGGPKQAELFSWSTAARSYADLYARIGCRPSRRM